MCLNMNTRLNVHMHIHLHMGIHMNIHACAYIHVLVHTCTIMHDMCTKYIYIEPQVPACRYAPILRDIQKHIHTCISIRTYTATCLHPFTHTQTQTVLVTLTFAFTYINIHANRQPNKRRPNNLPTLLQIHAC